MIAFVLRTLLVIACALMLSGVVGIAIFILVFASPVLLGQSEDSMLFWGWITTVPAIVLGWVAGIAMFIGLMRRLAEWRILASPQAQFDSAQALRTLIFVVTSLAITAVLVMVPPIRDVVLES
jgi:hypothetical protein